ncbi:MAG: prolyl oligopeptidase family serine peptidase [Salibacteraceae bacterium]
MRQGLITLLLLGIWAFSSNAQLVLSGLVSGPQNTALPYASLFLKKAGVGIVSKSDGRFQLVINNVAASQKLDTLVVSYVGYQKQFIPVYLEAGALPTLRIRLMPSSTSLQEVVIAAERNYTPVQLVKLAIKKVRKNYIQDPVTMEGFYRELVQENGEYIDLNEASIQLNYSPYPQKRFTRKAFHAYWDRRDYTMSYGMSLSTVFRHSIYFPYYVPPKDEAALLATRASTNNSRSGQKASPVGGPLDLVALDRIKYHYDFLDRKLLKDYDFQRLGKDYVDEELCYVIDFKPKSDYAKTVFQGFNKRMQYALYVGQLYVAVRDFAVLQINSHLSVDADFSLYRDHPLIPEFAQAEVRYQRYQGRLVLHRVNLEQRNLIESGKRPINFTSHRTLHLFAPEEQKPIAEPEQLIPIKHFSSLKERSLTYDASFWERYEKGPHYPALPGKAWSDLNRFASLHKQFESVNYPIDSLPVPMPKAQPEQVVYPTDTLMDEFAWLRDPNSSATLDYLKEENDYYEGVTRKLLPYRRKFYYQYLNLFAKDTTQTKAPWKPGELRLAQDSLGKIGFYRMVNGQKELVLDRSHAARGKVNFFIEDLRFNRHRQLSYTYSQQGDISFTLLVKAVGQNNSLDSLAHVYEFLWLDDSTLLYTETDSVTFRACRLRTHRLGTKQAQDALWYDEKQSGFDLRIDTSASGQYRFFYRESLDASACFLVVSEADSLHLDTLAPLVSQHFQTLYHFGGDTLFRVTRSGLGSQLWARSLTDRHSWQRLYQTPHAIQDLRQTRNYLAVQEYVTNGLVLNRLNLRSLNVQSIDLPVKLATFEFDGSASRATNNELKIIFESPTTPYQTLAIDLGSQNTEVVKQERTNAYVFGGDYQCEILWAQTADGTRVPVTVFYDQQRIKAKAKGLLVKAYGAYGATHYPFFEPEDVVYANDSMVVAYVHSRGGSELGQEWYRNGKLLHKKNTFTDYIAAVEHLQQHYKVAPAQTIGTGTSAGGLVMGYAANERPELFGGLIFDKPYLDVITTMMDSTLPLTAMEYDEWGNPNDSTYYAYIKSYSPYQNIQRKHYPAMLFYGKLHDQQTPYWQVAKCAARYRQNNLSNRLILLHTSFTGGHRGATSYEVGIDEAANKFAFVSYVLRHRAPLSPTTQLK